MSEDCDELIYLLSMISKSKKSDTAVNGNYSEALYPVAEINPKVEKTSVRPKRCQMAECKTKLALTDSACKCAGIYCMKHRHAELHSCTFDYKGEGMNKLKAQLPEVRGTKLENI
jgi:hypothetical protein